MSTQGQIGYLTQLLAVMRQQQTGTPTPAADADLISVNVQPYDADLVAIAGLTGTNGLLRKTGLNTWILDTSTYLTSITSSQVTTALGYTPVTNARTLTINGVTYDLTADRSWTIAGGVTSFNTRTGAITLSSTDVTGALGFTPYNATNPSGYISSYTETDPTVGSHIKAITTTNISNWNTAYGWGNHALAGYLTGITSGQVTTALGFTPENAGNKGVANGYASLDGSGLVPSTQLPSYVDDVLEYANLAVFPATGTTGKIYIDLATNKVYRWSGTVYIEVSPTVGTIWGGITGTLANQTDLQTALDAKVPTSRTLTINGTPFDLTANRSWTINSMVYPAAGIAVSTGTAWGTSITDNSTNWNTAYSSRISSLTVTGSSGAATLVSNVLNIPTYTLAGLGGQASSTNLTSLSGLTYVSASFVKMTATGTFSLDTNTYYLASNPSGYTNNTGTVTSVSGTGTVSGLSISGTVTTTGNITLSGTLAVTASNFSSQTANTFLAAPTGLAGVPTFRTIVAADIPTLNQNTSGSAGSVSNSLILKADTGTTEGTDLYTYNGSAAKTLNIVAGSNITITKTAGQWSIAAAAGATGTVSSVSVTTANGISGTVATATTTPAITLSLGAITPTSVNGITLSGSTTPTLAVTGTSSISGSNTGDNAVNSLYSGLVSNATHTGDATGSTALTVVGLRGVTLPALGATAGLLKYTGTGTNTWVFDSTAYGTGSVTSVGGTGTVSGLTLTGTVTTTGSLTLGGTLSVLPSNFASQTANTFLAAPNGAAGTPTFRAIVAADIPTLNQNTTGTAANSTLWNSLAYSGAALASSVLYTMVYDGTNSRQGVASAAQMATFISGQTMNIVGSASTITGVYGGTLTSSQITTGLGFTPYNSTNPSGYITSAGSISGNAASATYANTLYTSDTRTISPSSHTAYRATFGFTSWANNNTSPYADYFNLRSYSDSSGGNDNLIMFRKDALGIRIWQQTFGSATAYASYKDVAWTDGTNASGTWGISISGNAATATTATTATNWGSYGAVPAAGTSFGTANTIGRSDGNGYTFFYYINSSTANSENPAVSQVITTNGTDNYYRKSSIASFTGYVQSNASGSWGISVTGSAGSVAWTNVSGRPTAVSSFTNDSGYITSSGSISGNAATASSSPLLSALGNYAWGASTTPTGFNMGIQSSFVRAVDGWQNFGSVVNVNTYSGGGGSLQLYVPYSPTYGGNALQVRFGNYDVSTGNSWTAWKTLLQSDNYNSYAPTLTGGGASGTWGISITGNAATAGGFTPSQTSGTANRIVVADANGYIVNNYFYASGGGSERNASGMGYFAGHNTSDYYYRSYTAAAAAALLSGQTMNIAGSSTSCTGNAATVTNATFYRQFIVRDDRTDGSDYSLAGRATGLYAINSTGTNGPGYGYLSLIHVANSTDVAFQIAGGYNSDAMYFRGTTALQSGTGYSAWRTVIHSGNIGSQSVSYATTSGALTSMNISQFTNNSGYITGITSGNVTTALGYTPYNSTNPSGYITNTNGAYYVTAGEGNGVYFWQDSTNYTIKMGVTAGTYQYGPVTDYSMRFTMGGGTARGFVWGYAGSSPTMGLNASSGNLQIAGTFTEASSIRYKDNVADLTYTLEDVLKLRSVTYTKKGTDHVELGFIAEEVNDIIPEAVMKNTDGSVESISYGRLTAVLLNAVKEQQKQIDELKNLLNK